VCQKTFKIQINGRVQGVGFRPFVFNLAKKYKLSGNVSNNAKGVIIYINTPKEKATKFLEQILQLKPEVSIITDYFIEEVFFNEYDTFSILPSENKEKIDIPLTPDFAVCEKCKGEIKDVTNRRYNYAFTTCVHCGPRYAVTTMYPFERANTSLTSFKTCNACQEEYENPSNKRFHSQTNSCGKCGITLKLVDNEDNVVGENQENIIKKVAQFISEGKIIAIKNTNGYLLCCDAKNIEAIQHLRERKQRPNKPFAVLYPTIEAIKNEFELTSKEYDELLSRVAPIVILQNTKNTTIAVKAIAPRLNQTGVMLPSSSLLEILMQKLKKPIIATSGNIHGSPIISEEKEADEKLKGVADYFLHHNLAIEFPQDDSVVKFVNDKQIILRRSRGLAPNYLEILTKKTEPILAMGAHLKSTFAFVPNTHTYVSQYFGNLDSYEVSERYKTTIKQYAKLFGVIPKTILIDKHLQYQSSIIGNELSQKWNAELVEIQHHKAHFTSVLGEYNLFDSEEKILGVVWDGTGLGDDNNIWGGEFFIYENEEINLLTHFEYFDWIANDKMAIEPRLSLFSLLDDEQRDLIKDKFSKTEWKVYSKTIKDNTLKTSSVGRLFDAVASALNIIDINTFEAEAAMLLENCANEYTKNVPIDFLFEEDFKIIPTQLIIKNLLKAYNQGASKEKLANSFISTLANIIIKVAKSKDISTIVCSGGVFQNSLLVSVLNRLTKEEEIDLKLNRKLSSNDENVSFGQLMYYQHIKN